MDEELGQFIFAVLSRYEGMSWDFLLDKPMAELDLLNHVTAELQARYLELQDRCFFLKIEKIDENASKIVWYRTFNDIHTLWDFYFDSIMERACIMTKFENGRYEVLFQGFHHLERFWLTETEVTRGPHMKCSGSIETRRMTSRELLEKGFGEISDQLGAVKWPKAV